MPGDLRAAIEAVQGTAETLAARLEQLADAATRLGPSKLFASGAARRQMPNVAPSPHGSLGGSGGAPETEALLGAAAKAVG